MSDDAQTAVVDLIAQRPISEIDTTSDDVSERLIALGCGHIFTVETLDSHCTMSEYYEIDPMTGGYIAVKAPPVKFQTLPACPTCRGPITSPRYSRVTKRANLDILEQNVANNMSKRLEKHLPSIETIAACLEALETAAKAVASGGDFASEDDLARICEERMGLLRNPEEPLLVIMLTGFGGRHGFSKKEVERWEKIKKEINCVYDGIVDVASARSVHMKAYEAAMTTLFKLEMDAIAQETSKAGRKSQQEAAPDAVSAKIVQPPHKADRKYLIEAFLLSIEAFLLSIELRLMLAQIASARVAELLLTSNEPDHPRHRKIWITFVGFLYESCIKDCAKPIALERPLSAPRQEARVSMVGLRCNFEKVRFNALEQRRKIQILDRSGDLQLHTREGLGAFVSQQRVAAQKALSEARTKYLQNRPAHSQTEMDGKDLWFQENCTSRAEKIFTAYEDLQEHVLKAEVSYQPVPTREKQDIFKAFNSGAQHTYNIRLSPPLTEFVQVAAEVSSTAGTDIPSPLLRYVKYFPMPNSV